MKLIHCLKATLLSIALFTSLFAQSLFIEPDQIENRLHVGDSNENVINITNRGDQPLIWHIKKEITSEPDHEIQRRQPDQNGPRRDDAGDMLVGHAPKDYPHSAFDGEFIWGLWAMLRDIDRIYRIDPENLEVIDEYVIHESSSGMRMCRVNNTFWISTGTNRLGPMYIYNFEGELLEQFTFPLSGPQSMTHDPQRNIVFVYKSGVVYGFDAENHNLVDFIEATDIIEVTGLNEDVENEVINSLRLNGVYWVPEHHDGHLWAHFFWRPIGEGMIMLEYWLIQISVDEDWNMEEVQRFQVLESNSALVHDGENFWWGWNEYDDGIVEYPWITFDPTNGEIAPDSDRDVFITLDASECVEGEYNAILHMKSNDPETPDYEIEVVLNVEGDPDIALSWEFGQDNNLINWSEYYPAIYANEEYPISLCIQNPGTGPLIIEDIFFDSDAFSTELDANVVSPLDEMEIDVLFSSDEVGEFGGEMLIISNAMDNDEISIDLNATTILPPEIVVNPGEIQDNLVVDWQAEHIIQISNVGDSELEWYSRIEFFENQELVQVNSPKTILDAPLRDDPGDIIETIITPFRRFQTMTWDGENIWGTDDGHNLFAIQTERRLVTLFQQLEFSMAAIVFDGRNLIVSCFGWHDNFRIFDLEGNLLNTFDLPIWEVRSMAFDGENHIFMHSWFDDKIHVLSVEDFTEVACFEIPEELVNDEILYIIWVPSHLDGQLWGRGRNGIYQFHIDFSDDWAIEVVSEHDWGFEAQFYTILTHDGQNFIAGSFESRNIFVIEDDIDEYFWLDVNPESGEIAAEDETEITVTLDPSGLFDGDYQANLHVMSNDPTNPDVAVEINLTVEGIPTIDLRWLEGHEENLIDWEEYYRETFRNGEYAVPIRVRNAGSAELEIEEISFDDEAFHTDNQQFTVPMRDERTIEIMFTPEEVGEFQSVMRIRSNDPEAEISSVNLRAESEAEPVILVEPDRLETELVQGEDERLEITIFNEGESRLRWKITKETVEPEEQFLSHRRTARNISYPHLNESKNSPVRDDPGEIIREMEAPYLFVKGLAWDGELMWCVDSYLNHLSALDPESGEIEYLVQLPEECGGIAFDGTNLWIDCYERERGMYIYNLQGRQRDYIERSGGASMTSDQDGHIFMLLAGNVMHVIDTESLELIATINLEDVIHETAINAIEWVSSHYDGQLWCVTRFNRVHQIYVDNDWNACVVRSFQIDQEESTLHLAHDGINLYTANYTDRILTVIDDGVDEVHWINLSLRSGVTVAREQRIGVTIDTDRLLGGNYAAILNIESNDPVTPLIEIPVVINVIGVPRMETDPVAEPARNADELRFRNVIIGTEITENISISNIGSADLVIDRTEFSDGNVLSTDLDDGTVIAPHTRIETTVTFTPDEPGDLQARLDIYTNAENVGEENDPGHIWFNISGEAIIPPVIVTDPENDSDILVNMEINDEPVVRTLVIGNQGEQGAADIEFTITKAEVQEGLFRAVQASSRNGGNINENRPHRDRPGDIISRHRIPHATDGLTWDGQLMWGVSYTRGRLWAYNPETGDFPFDSDYAQLGQPTSITYCENSIWICTSNPFTGLARYDLQGNYLETLEFDGVFSVLTSDKRDFIFTFRIGTGVVRAYSLATREYVAEFEIWDAIGNDEIFNLEWVPEHYDGQLWALSDTRLYQIHVDENWEVELVQDFECNIVNGRAGLAHDGTNLWVGRSADNIYNWIVVDDGVEEQGPLRWLTVEPLEGSIAPGEEIEVQLTFDTEGLEDGVQYRGNLILESNDPENGILLFPVTLNMGSYRLNMHLNEGWNLISINVAPPEEFWEVDEGPDVILMTERLRIDENNHHIRLMKNGVGQFYSPAFNFNNIPYWELTEGYQVSVDEDIDVSWSGEPIPPDSDIPFDVGWNMIAYFPTYELDASAPDFYVLSPIIDHVVIAKNAVGNFMLPAFNFSNMPPWRPTQGYHVRVDEDVVLNYPEQQDEVAFELALADAPVCQKIHWISPTPTGENMSVLVTSVEGLKLNTGDQIAAFNSAGLMVGQGSFCYGKVGLAVWGDDLNTEAIDGLAKDESFELRLWDADLEIELPLQVRKIHMGKALTYETDDILALDVSVKPLIPDDYFIAEPYPNPFNPSTQIVFGLPEDSHVSLKVYDIAGRLVTNLINEEYPAGTHHAIWDADRTPTGLYLIRMESKGYHSVRKAMLVK